MTRHPKGKHWTYKELNAITPEWKGDILNDSENLLGEIRVSLAGVVSVSFRYGFKWEGKKKWFYAGAWPSVDMAEIRARRNKARDDVAQGVNPNDKKISDRIERQQAIAQTIRQAELEKVDTRTVQDLFDAWVKDGVARKDENKELKRLFQKDVLPEIGSIVLSKLTDRDIRGMLRNMLKRGVVRIAILAFQDLSQMLSWGEKRQPWRRLLANGNPADLVDIDKLVPLDYEEERDRVLSHAELMELKQKFQRMDEDYEAAPDKRTAPRPVDVKTRVALWLCLSTLCRIGELLMARWEHVDMEKGVWFVPRANVKGRRAKKKEHYVYLSAFSRGQFEALKKITGNSEWCFPGKNRIDENIHVSVKTVTKQVADRQIRLKNRNKPLKGRACDNSLVLARGANGDWTPHDLRRTGATMMQGLGVSMDVIDRCQNHLMPGRVRRVYLRHDYEKEKTHAWQMLSDLLSSILS